MGGLALGGFFAVPALLGGSGDPGSGNPSPGKSHAAEGGRPSAQSPSPPAGPQLTGAEAKNAPVPILMYHSISIPPSGASLPELFVPTKDFTDQMHFLKDRGYQAVSLDQVWSAWHGGGSLPAHPVVLSFDDGYVTQFSHAAPVLKGLGWPGVLNLKLLSLEQGEMTDREVKQMISDGWEVDSHTINHADVSTISGAQLHHEIADSRTMLQTRFGVPVNFFCYPSGRYDAEAIAALRAAGYEGATTVREGVASAGEDPYTLPRIRIAGNDGVEGLKTKLVQAIGSS